MVADGVAFAVASGEFGVAVPSGTGLSTAPWPVRYTTTTEPDAAGFFVVFKVEPALAFCAMTWLLVSWKMPGAALVTMKRKGKLFPPPTVTKRLAIPAARPLGT